MGGWQGIMDGWWSSGSWVCGCTGEDMGRDTWCWVRWVKENGVWSNQVIRCRVRYGKGYVVLAAAVGERKRGME